MGLEQSSSVPTDSSVARTAWSPIMSAFLALAVGVRQRDLQRHPDPLDAVASLPDLATAALAEVFGQAVLAQPTPAPQRQARRAGCLDLGSIS